MQSGIRKYVKAIANIATAIVIFLLVIFVLPKILRFFMPFLVGWIIAMIANPLVHFFEQKIKIRRKAGSAIVIIAVLAGVVLLGYFLIAKLISEGAGFVSELPALWDDSGVLLAQVKENLSAVSARFPQTLRDNVNEIMGNLGTYISSVLNEVGEPAVSAVGDFAKNIPSVIIGVIMCLLSSYFFVAEK